MKWSSAPFEALYYSIEIDQFDVNLFHDLLPDLQQLNLNQGKQKNNASRTQLEKGELTLSDGSSYKFNQQFIIAAINLSDELNLDELVVAELIISGSESGAPLENMDNLSLINVGKRQYFFRRQYILQILAYLIDCLQNDNQIYKDLTQDAKLLNNILPAFESIHLQLSEVKDSINKAQILENFNSLIQQNIKFKMDSLLKEYDILSQILFGLINKESEIKQKTILDVVNHVTQMDSDDFFIVYYLPAIFHAFNNLDKFPDNDVKELHAQFLKDLEREDIYTKPIKVAIIFIFLTSFISWCKVNPKTRAKLIDFKTAVDEPMTAAVELGAIEQLLIIAADTSIVEQDKSMELFYDIRSLLERHIPRLRPKQLQMDRTGDNNNTTEVSSAITATTNTMTNDGSRSSLMDLNQQFQNIILSDQTESFFLSSFNCSLQRVIADCAFLLTKVKDAEEDSLLSGEDLSLDDVCVKADLERFFLTVYYFYASRPNLSCEFWNDKESNSYGFIEWSSKCTDSLMKSCFYLMISSLSFGHDNAINVFHYFGDNNAISWTTISQSISDYIVKINNLSKTVQQRQQQIEDTTTNNNNNELDSITVALDEGLNEEAIIFLSSLLTLIGSVAHDVDEDTKVILSNTFSNILFEFAKVDTPLIGACFKTLGQLVPEETSSKLNLWRSLDTLIFKTATLTNATDSYKSAFKSILINYNEILGFLQLFNNLLKIESTYLNTNGFLTFGKLSFPARLGQGYRKLGIWPYFDYILNDIFVSSHLIPDSDNRRAIQLPILEIIETSLYSFDYSIILNSLLIGTNLDQFGANLDFFTYVQESPATVIFNHLFTEKIYKSLFKIINVGVDHLSIDLGGGSTQLRLIKQGIKIINLVLEFQATFAEEFVNIITKQKNKEYYLPKNFGLHGLPSFYDAIFFNLPIVAHLGLYVGLDNYDVALESLNALIKLENNSPSNESGSAGPNKLLTIFDAVDDSARIKEASFYFSN